MIIKYLHGQYFKEIFLLKLNDVGENITLNGLILTYYYLSSHKWYNKVHML